MFLRDYSRNSFAAYDAWDAAQVARADAVVLRAQASAAEAQGISDSASGWWASLIGAGSANAGIQANAAAAVNLRDTLQAKRDRLVTDPNASEADVLDMEGTAASYATKNIEAAKAAALLTPGAAIDATLPHLGDIPWWVYGLAGLAVVAIVVPRRK